jgi:hypothetical protein
MKTVKLANLGEIATSTATTATSTPRAAQLRALASASFPVVLRSQWDRGQRGQQAGHKTKGSEGAPRGRLGGGGAPDRGLGEPDVTAALIQSVVMATSSTRPEPPWTMTSRTNPTP